MNLKEIERVVAGIEGQLFKSSNAKSIGMLKSHFKGSGIQFKEHQIYTPGDDVRFIDWKLSAKTTHTYIKTFEEERNVEIFVVLDLTPTMLMGYKNTSKLQAAIEIVCLLYLLAEKTKDHVTAVIFTKDKLVLPQATGHKGMAMLINQLQKLRLLTDEGKINILYDFENTFENKKKFNFLKSLIGRRKEVVYLSDFSEIEDLELLERFCLRPNMHCFRVISPLDEYNKLPFSVFSARGKKKKYIDILSSDSQTKFEGRYRKINVKDRYLDKFVKEML